MWFGQFLQELAEILGERPALLDSLPSAGALALRSCAVQKTLQYLFSQRQRIRTDVLCRR